MAKPLGYGNVKFEIDLKNSTIKDQNSLLKYMCLFEKLMTDFYPKWLKSEQMTELMSIATPISRNHSKINHLDYLKLEEFDSRLKKIEDLSVSKQAEE